MSDSKVSDEAASESDDGQERSLFKLKRDLVRERKRLGTLLSHARGIDFLTLIWALGAIGRGENELGLDHGPKFSAVEIETAGLQHYFNPWMLETLVNEYLCTPRRVDSARPGKPTKFLNTTVPQTAFHLLNALLTVENTEDGIWMKRGGNVIDLVTKIAQRQFPWQRGFATFFELYRAAYLFDFPEAKAQFLKAVGVSTSEYLRCGFGIYTVCTAKPTVKLDLDVSQIAISPAARDAVLRNISEPMLAARRKAVTLRTSSAITAYKPSFLRLRPCITFPQDGIFIAPLPGLVAARISGGMYYDIVSGGGTINQKLGDRFESYCRLILGSHLVGLTPASEYGYRLRKGFNFDSPDILLTDAGTIRLVVECKATKASHASKFADDIASEKGLAELAHGVFQIWRFFSHVRRGITERTIAADAVGILLTLDTWLDMSMNGRATILKLAKDLAATKDPEIIETDQRPVGVLHIQDLENTLETATPESFFAAIQKWTKVKEFGGWHLARTHDQEANRRDRLRARAFYDSLPVPEALEWLSAAR